MILIKISAIDEMINVKSFILARIMRQMNERSNVKASVWNMGYSEFIEG